MKITGAIFDMDGTLIDSLGFWDQLWATLGEKYRGDKTFRPDPVTEKGGRTSTIKGAAKLIHENCRMGENAEEIEILFEDMLGRYYMEVVEMKPGMRELLELFLKNGVKMCVASATSPNLLKMIMDKFGFRRYFSKVISCLEVGKGKEHPDVFIAAHEYLGTDKDTTWIFEDSTVALSTAVKAGFNTVGIYDKYNFGIDKVKEFSTVFVDKGEMAAEVLRIK